MEVAEVAEVVEVEVVISSESTFIRGLLEGSVETVPPSIIEVGCAFNFGSILISDAIADTVVFGCGRWLGTKARSPVARTPKKSSCNSE